MKILLLETATPVCSVALASDGVILSERVSADNNAHSAKLATFIDELFVEAGWSMKELDAVCVSSGPGSYTGLRIGVSSAKGICYALDIPLLAVPTLQSIAEQYFDMHKEYSGYVCPMLDARRMECYTAVYDRNGCVRETKAEIIEAGMYDVYMNEHQMVFVGNGAAKTETILSVNSNALFDNSFVVSAKGMLHTAERKLLEGDKEDVAYFEPFYLKDFVAKKSEVHGLR